MQEMQETKIQSLGWGDSLEKEMATYSSILPGKSYGLRSRVGYSPWGHKDLMTKQQQSEVIWAERTEGSPEKVLFNGRGPEGCYPNQSWDCHWRKLLPHLMQQRWTWGGPHPTPLCF